MKKRFPFLRRWRIHNQGDFKDVFSKGRPFFKDDLVLYAIANKRPYSRIGISISKKVGRAVERNRIRRLIREVYRMNVGRLKKGMDIVLVVRPGCKGDDLYSMERSLLDLLRMADLLEMG